MLDKELMMWNGIKKQPTDQRMGRDKKQCTQTMQTRGVGWVVRNKYLGDHHHHNNG
jgi:hypothetical protein